MTDKDRPSLETNRRPARASRTGPGAAPSGLPDAAHGPGRNGSRSAGEYAPLWFCLGVFLLAVLFVNPLREAALEDDWAYAETVHHLHDTGQFRLNAWLSANMPFQAYWGDLFVRLLGYSYASLRIATLALVAVGLVAFFFLAREHGLPPPLAGLLTLALVGSPIVLYLSFSFMTDVPYLMGLILATFLYTRAIRLHSYPWMVGASVAAAAAILTRQFGVALIAAAVAQWALGKDRWRQVPFFLSGLILPAAAAGWQFYAGLASPTWAAALNKHGQMLYLTSGMAAADAPWRLTVILEYAALFALPLVLLLVLHHVLDYPRPARRWLVALVLLGAAAGVGRVAWLGWRSVTGETKSLLAESLLVLGGLAVVYAAGWLLAHRKQLDVEPGQSAAGRPGAGIVLMAVLAVLFAGGALYGHAVGIPHLVRFMGEATFSYEAPGKFQFWLMPYLPWILDDWRLLWPSQRLNLTLAVVVGGVLLARVLVARGLSYRAGAVPPSQRFLDLTALFLLAAALVYHHLGDEYLIVFQPVALILVGRSLRGWLAPRGLRAALTVVCVLALAASALWVRGRLAKAEAHWQAAEAARATGADLRQVWGNWEWSCYHGAFDDYLAQLGGEKPETFDDFFYWWGQQSLRAQFLVMDTPVGEPFEPAFNVSYRDEFWRERQVTVWKRKAADPGPN